MHKFILRLLATLVLTAGFTVAMAANPVVVMKTSMGDIEIELAEDKAPNTVANFLKYANNGHYSGTIFHRVIDGFMIQGGGFTADMQQKPTDAPIANEANNGLKNDRGTIAMARRPDPHSATAQFFINVVNNDSLNYRNSSPSGWGYAVFGKVIKGMNIVDQIRQVDTGPKGHFGRNVPQTTVLIESVSVKSSDS